MADAAEEAGEMASLSGSLVLNIGTLNAGIIKSMLLAGKAANNHKIPIILDPVGWEPPAQDGKLPTPLG